MKKALLTIVTKQPEIDENMTFTTRTECVETENGLKVNYEESLSEEDTVNTELLIGDDTIMVERQGEAGGNMFFKKNTTYETRYYAMGGISLDMKIFTTNLDIDKNEKGITATVDYQLFLAGSSVGKMGMDIKVDYI